MMNLKQLLRRPLQALPNSLVLFLLVVALLGFADSMYLAIEHFQGIIPPCSLVGGCEKVLTSSYSTLFGIPVSLFGAAYYLIISIACFAYLEGRYETIMKFSLYFTIFGLIASLWFVFIQAFVIHSYCLYCLGSAITSTILFVSAVVTLKKYQVATSK